MRSVASGAVEKASMVVGGRLLTRRPSRFRLRSTDWPPPSEFLERGIRVRQARAWRNASRWRHELPSIYEKSGTSPQTDPRVCGSCGSSIESRNARTHRATALESARDAYPIRQSWTFALRSPAEPVTAIRER
jgi:hypothetical protein